MGTIFHWLAFIVGGFLLGGVMFCRLIPLLFLKKDVSLLYADKNPGAANVFKSCGVAWGMACLLCDMLKGFIPVFLAQMIMKDTDSFFYSFVIAAPVLGHALGVFNGFHGGKCISTAFGVLLGVHPITFSGWILAALYVFFSLFVKIKPHRRRSLFAFAIFAISACTILIVRQLYSISLGFFLLSAIAIVKHTKWFSPDEEPATKTVEEGLAEAEVAADSEK